VGSLRLAGAKSAAPAPAPDAHRPAIPAPRQTSGAQADCTRLGMGDRCKPNSITGPLGTTLANNRNPSQRGFPIMGQ
jgi:hypothetical protein